MEKIELPITTEYIKLDQLLKFSGIAENGADAKDMILDEMVSFNGGNLHDAREEGTAGRYGHNCVWRWNRADNGKIICIFISLRFKISVIMKRRLFRF